MKATEGGHAKVLGGNSLGILLPMWKNGWSKISSIDGRLAGSSTKIFVIKSLASSEIGTASGKLYWIALIRLYVYFISEVSNGGFPIIIA